MDFILTSLLNYRRTSKKGAQQTSLLASSLLILSLSALLSGCSGGDAPAAAITGGSSSSSTTSAGYTLYLNTDQISINTDDVDNATITATVVKDNVSQANVSVAFATTGGLLTNPNVLTTGSDGKASITLTSGPRASNQVASVSASSFGASASVPIQITGNTLALSITQANMAMGVPQTLTALLQDATPLGISSAPVTFTVVSGGNVVSLSKTSATTNFSGESQITVNGVAPGTAVILASSLGATAQINITVAAAAQVFEITSPTSNPASMSTDSSLIFTVNAPGRANVTFQTTVGVWNGSSSTETVAVIGGVATATLTSAFTGIASITVIDPAPADPDNVASDTLEVNLYAPPSQAATITLESSLYNMPVSTTGSPANSAFITATVRTSSGGVVGNAQVTFTVTDPLGSGAKLNTGIATTNSSGAATITFYSGTLESSAEGIKITATVAGTDPASVFIVVTSRPGSIALGASTGLSGTDIYYEQEIIVMAADANGNPVENSEIFLKLWPTWYYMGYWTVVSADDPKCARHDTRWPNLTCDNPPYHANEDVNMNLSLDAGEDDGPMGFPDGFLTPPNAAAGTIPAMVITDATGKASFKITYLKQYASWIQVHLEASTSVQMTESLATLDWRLGVTAADAANCAGARMVFDSPFGYTMCD